MVFLFFTALI